MRDLVGICHNRPSTRLSASALAVSKLRFRLRLRLHGVAPQYAISDGRLARPHIPASRLFVLFHSSKAPSHQKKRNIPYWYCPLCTPSLTLPPSSLKCLQKSNPNIHRKCFGCFKCFHPTGYYKIKTDTYSFDGVE